MACFTSTKDLCNEDGELQKVENQKPFQKNMLDSVVYLSVACNTPMRLLTFIILFAIYSCNPGQMKQHETKLVLSGQKLTAIPDSVFDKTELTYLDLGSSSIVFYPPLSALTDTNANSISEIPNKIEKLINLKTLILNSNKLKTLPNSITKLTNLEVLDLSINQELDITKELDKLKQMKKLKVLKIAGVELRRDDYETIKKALPNVKIIATIPEYFESLK